MPATFYIASLPFQDTPPNGGYLKRFACTFGSQCLTIVGIIDP
jgi:hypothetical protein